ncbi:hypothetical protein HK102_003013 [Quaeritorhiza haematococci]|nr:hypothetical protein HK102_003013 [Quaeritorhiza haematococci]
MDLFAQINTHLDLIQHLPVDPQTLALCLAVPVAMISLFCAPRGVRGVKRKREEKQVQDDTENGTMPSTASSEDVNVGTKEHIQDRKKMRLLPNPLEYGDSNIKPTSTSTSSRTKTSQQQPPKPRSKKTRRTRNPLKLRRRRTSTDSSYHEDSDTPPTPTTSTTTAKRMITRSAAEILSAMTGQMTAGKEGRVRRSARLAAVKALKEGVYPEFEALSRELGVDSPLLSQTTSPVVEEFGFVVDRTGVAKSKVKKEGDVDADRSGVNMGCLTPPMTPTILEGHVGMDDEVFAPASATMKLPSLFVSRGEDGDDFAATFVEFPQVVDSKLGGDSKDSGTGNIEKGLTLASLMSGKFLSKSAKKKGRNGEKMKTGPYHEGITNNVFKPAIGPLLGVGPSPFHTRNIHILSDFLYSSEFFKQAEADTLRKETQPETPPKPSQKTQDGKAFGKRKSKAGTRDKGKEEKKELPVTVVLGPKAREWIVSRGGGTMSKSKYYAVSIGRRPGIYTSWDQCRQQVEGTRNEYKSFPTLDAALAFLRQRSANAAPGGPRFNEEQLQQLKDKIMTDMRGGKAGSSGSSSAAGAAPGGANVNAAKGKGRAADVRPGSGGAGSSVSQQSAGVVKSMKRDAEPSRTVDEIRDETSPAKKLKSTSIIETALQNNKVQNEQEYDDDEFDDDLDDALLVAAAEETERKFHADEARRAQQQQQQQQQGGSQMLEVWTDGACSKNGNSGARAGIGVYFGPNDSRNISERLPGENQTNNRAELLAVIRALEVIPQHINLKLYSDSSYVLNGIKQWMRNWKRNGWITATKKPVLNQDLWMRLDQLIESRSGPIDWVHVRGHSGVAGNEGADQLAVMGANLPAIP